MKKKKRLWNILVPTLSPAVAQTGRCAHLFQLLLCSASNFIQSIELISPSIRIRAVLRPVRLGNPSGPIPIQAAAVCGGRQRGEVGDEGVVGLQRRGSRGGGGSQGSSQIRGRVEDHPGSGAARQPPGQEVCLGVLQPGWRWHNVGRGVSVNQGLLIRDLNDRLKIDFIRKKHFATRSLIPLALLLKVCSVMLISKTANSKWQPCNVCHNPAATCRLMVSKHI